MLNPLNYLSKLIKSPNEKELDTEASRAGVSKHIFVKP